MNSKRYVNLAFLLVGLLYVLYAGAYIYKTSFMLEGERYFCLFDDAMISMRYADHLAAGQGLVFNSGEEAVEGYTNPLWVVMMAVFHLFPISASKISLCVQLAGMVFLLFNLYFVRKITEFATDGSVFAALCAVVLTAFFLPLNTWGLQGMEVSALVLLATASFGLLLRSLQEGRYSFWPYFGLGLGSLLRPDGIILLAVAFVYAAVVDRPYRKAHLGSGLAFMLLFAGLQTAFRVYYYGDILPNTYYLKMTGYPLLLRWCAGFVNYYQVVFKMNMLLFLFPLAAVWIWRRKNMTLLFCAFVVQSAYDVYVGGDAWGWGVNASRYTCVVMPFLFVMTGYGMDRLVRWIGTLWAASPRAGLFGRCAWLLLFMLFFLNFNALATPQALAEWLLITPPFEVPGNQRRVDLALHLKRITRPEARVALVYAGAIPYFMDRPVLDLLGKNDRRIAHEKMRVVGGLWRFIYFYPGHLKWNYGYSIGELKPDVVAQLWWSPEEAQPYLGDYTVRRYGGFTYYLRTTSTNLIAATASP